MDDQARWVSIVEKGGTLLDEGRLSKEAEDGMRRVINAYLTAIELDTRVEETRVAMGWSKQPLLPAPQEGTDP